MESHQEQLRQRVRKKVADDLYNKLYGDPASEVDGDENGKKKPAQPQKKLTISNVAWLIAAIFVLYYTDILNAALYNPQVKSVWLYSGICLILLNVATALYLIVVVSYFQKVSSDDWEFLYPNAIPIATACFVFGSICLTVAFWPVYSYLTPVVLFTIFMGYVIVVSWLPAL